MSLLMFGDWFLRFWVILFYCKDDKASPSETQVIRGRNRVFSPFFLSVGSGLRLSLVTPIYVFLSVGCTSINVVRDRGVFFLVRDNLRADFIITVCAWMVNIQNLSISLCACVCACVCMRVCTLVIYSYRRVRPLSVSVWTATNPVQFPDESSIWFICPRTSVILQSTHIHIICFKHW